MSVLEYTFNTSPVAVGDPLDIPARASDVENTPNLRRSSVKDAYLFGGPLVKTALDHCPLTGRNPHVFVDTKVTLLMRGWYPSIPGWHTDGVPRGRGGEGEPGYGDPDLSEQLRQEKAGYFPVYHTIVLGMPNLTRFLADPLTLELENHQNSDLYLEMSKKVNALMASDELDVVEHTAGQWLTWDWGNIHSATPAEGRGWRLLIRVTESDSPPAAVKFLRSQSQVYVPTEFGW